MPEMNEFEREPWVYVHAFCKFSFKSLQRFRRRRQKCEKFTNNGQWVIPIAPLSLWLRCANKGPKGTHIVHLSTMCHICWQIGQGSHPGFLIGLKNTNLVEDVEILLPIKFRQIQFSGFWAVQNSKLPLADSLSLTLCKSYLSQCKLI